MARGWVVPGGVLVAANHPGHLDILVLPASTPMVFVAKAEVRGGPVFGWLAAAAGIRFIDREARGDVPRVGREMAEAEDGEVTVMIFPRLP